MRMDAKTEFMYVSLTAYEWVNLNREAYIIVHVPVCWFLELVDPQVNLKVFIDFDPQVQAATMMNLSFFLFLL